MKRIFIICTMILLALTVSQAKDLSELFETFKKEKHADYVSVSPIMMKIACLFTLADKDAKVLHRIRSFKVLDLDGCSSEVKQRFNMEVDDINNEGYEEMMRVKNKGEVVRIFVKQEENVIREMLIFVGGNDCTLVALTGKIRQKDIAKIVDKHIYDKHEH